jgi:exodeoxyribonuclease V gamma subunit
MPVHIHRSERADTLADGLAELLSRPLEDPFTAEIVAVPTRGVERWLAQRLASRLGAGVGGDGVCATIEFCSVAALTGVALAGALAVDVRDDPWRPDQLTWPVLAEIEAARHEPWAHVLWSFLGGAAIESDPVPTGRSPGRRWSTAAHLATLYSRYAVHRPEMIRAWIDGRDAGPDGADLGPGFAWQPELWRRVRARIDTPSPAERLPAACGALAEQPELSPLPPRVSVFGATRVDPDQLRVLDALADHREVHLWLTHPSPALWAEVAAAQVEAPVGPRRADRTATVPRHRLLAYLGRDVRELQLQLATGAVPHEDEALPGLPPASVTDPPATLLARLQADLSADRPGPAPDARPVLADADTSIQVHVSHGPDRQVEVLREVLLGLLEDDPSLEPRDIVVLCPDIETFAPLIAATFGLDAAAGDPGARERAEGAPEHPGHQLRVRLADRALRRINPLLSVLDRLLDLADSRMPASALLDLASTPQVARRFGFTEDDLERLAELVRAAGVRWGLDAAQRGRFGLSGFGQNTWAAGLDRMLLGIAMDAEGEYFIGTALPLDEIDSGDVDLVGRLAELVSRVGSFSRAVTADQRHPLRWWMDACQRVLDDVAEAPANEHWQTAHAYGELARLSELAQADADEPAGSVEVSLADVRAMLADAFQGRASRANFRTGTLTMCTMLPMRSVPHRVICLLGVDDATFPRHRLPDGDDILAADPWVGDRDPRSEDRQLLLDSVMAAQERLIIVYSGIDARAGTSKPVAVPIGELLDSLEETATTSDGRRVRDWISTRHTLQPFDRDNFVPYAGGNRVDPQPLSFDPAALRGAEAAARARRPAVDPFAVVDLAPLPPVEEVGLDELTRFFQHPIRALLRLRAQLRLTHEEEADAEQIPIALHGLDTWSIGNRLLQRHLDGIDLDQLVAAEWRRGALPPRALGTRTLAPVASEVASLAAVVEPYLAADREAHDVELELGGRTVAGTVGTVHGRQIVTVLYSWLGAKHRLQAWIQLLALSAAAPDVPWQAVTVGRGGRSILGPVPADFARQVLDDLITLYDLGRNEPLPFAPKTSAQYARIRIEGKSVAALQGVLQREWTGDRSRGGERDADYARFLPASVTDLLAERSRPQDARGSLAEPSRFGSLARRVWQPVLSCEESR